MTPTPQPPRLARQLARWLLRGDTREVIAGDLDQEFTERIAEGGTIAAARRHYWRQSLASVGAVHREAWSRRFGSLDRLRPLQGLGLDLRAVLRILRRSPGYAAVAILSLAIGIGASTAVVSVVRQILLQRLPVDRPDELRLIYWSPQNAQLGFSNLNSSGFRDDAGVYYNSNYSWADYTAMRAAASDGTEICGFNSAGSLTVSIDGRPSVAANGLLVTGNFFSTVRPPLARGRGLAGADDTPASPLVAVIGYGLWTRLFGNDPSVINKTVRVNDVPVTIVGVTADGYRGLSPSGFSAETDITLALASQPLIVSRWSQPGRPLTSTPTLKWIRAMARVQAGRDAALTESLQTTLRRTFTDAGAQAAVAAKVTIGVFPGARGLDSLRTQLIQPLRILSMVVGIVLLIACLNVAGLMLARGVSQQRELVIRRALGAGRARIMRQLLLESLILSAAGGISGLLLALLAAPVLESLLTAGLGTQGVSVALDWPLLGTTAAIACTCGLLAGLLPSLRFSRHAGAFLHARAGTSAPKLRVGRALLVLQIAISLPLVVGAGLLLRTLHNFGRIELGFNPHDLVVFSLDPTLSGKRPDRPAVVFPELLDRIEAIPGVTSATLIENVLISGWESNSTAFVDGQKIDMYMNAVGPHYHETMQVPLLEGRAVGNSDVYGHTPAVVINQTAATKYFKGSAVGRHFTVGSQDVEVVGVAGDTKYDGMRNEVPATMLQSYLQRRMGGMHVVVRTAVPAATLQPAIQRAVAAIDPAMPITALTTQDDQIDESIGKERVFTRLLSVFGLFALLLASVGLHGVTSYSVARRTSEFGVRIALGAQRSQLLWIVLRQVIVLAIIGLAIGIPIAWLAGPAVQSLLFGLEPSDPATLAVASIVMAFVALAAGLRPARRAAKMEALQALRAE